MKRILAALLIACASLAQAQTFVRQGGAIYNATSGAYVGHINLNTGKEELLTATLGSGLTATAVICTDSAKALTSTCSSATPSFGATTVTTLTASGHLTIEGVTSTGATGTGAFVFATQPTLVKPIGTCTDDLCLRLTGTNGAGTPLGFGWRAEATEAGAAMYIGGATTNDAALIFYSSDRGAGALKAISFDREFQGHGITLTTAAGGSATDRLAITSAGAATLTGTLRVSSGTAANQLRTAQTTAPTCTTNCGTSPSVTGTDTSGFVTMGASGVPASGWVVTFNGTWAAAPSCIVQSALATMVVGKMPIAVVATTTTMTVTTNGTAPATSDKYQYICIGVS